MKANTLYNVLVLGFISFRQNNIVSDIPYNFTRYKGYFKHQSFPFNCILKRLLNDFLDN